MRLVPLWLWMIVIGGLGYGLVEVGLRDRRQARQRGRRLRAHAARIGFRHHGRDEHREVTALLMLLPDLDRPGTVGPLFEGGLIDGTPATVFDFVEAADPHHPRRQVGFVLYYPTEWPTFEIGPGGMQALAPSGNAHAFARSLLASELCEYLAAFPGWVFAFSGPYAFGATRRGDGDDLGRVLDVAEGVADRIPTDLITVWAAAPEPERRAS
jgi:hypothetical protein